MVFIVLSHIVMINLSQAVISEREVFGITRGSVKWFNNEKGYGFITCENMDDIFVHYSAINKEGYKTLKENEVVEFKLIETTKGLQAVEVTELAMSVI